MAIHLFAKTNHPRLVEILFPLLGNFVLPKGTTYGSMERWPEADVLQGRLDGAHLPELLRLVADGRGAGYLLMTLAVSIRTDAAARAALDYLDARQADMANRRREHRARVALRMVLAALLRRRNLETARTLFGRLDDYVEPARALVAQELRNAWPMPRMTLGSVTVCPGFPRPPVYTDEEKAFATDLWRPYLEKRRERDLRRAQERERRR